MRLISLTQNQCTKVDGADYSWLNQWKWYAWWNPRTESFYAVRNYRENGKQHSISMQREILGLKRRDRRIGDHWNGDTLDNQRGNLRITDSRGNSQNRKIHRAGKLVGASFRKANGKWQARIRVGSEEKHLGYFPTELKAHETYLEAVETA